MIVANAPTYLLKPRALICVDDSNVTAFTKRIKHINLAIFATLDYAFAFVHSTITTGICPKEVPASNNVLDRQP